jgi:hypothetical protein
VPWPNPVDPSFSRAARLAATFARARPAFASNNVPISSNSRAFVSASRPSTMLEVGSKLAIWFMGNTSATGAARRKGNRRRSVQPRDQYPPETRG